MRSVTRGRRESCRYLQYQRFLKRLSIQCWQKVEAIDSSKNDSKKRVAFLVWSFFFVWKNQSVASSIANVYILSSIIGLRVERDGWVYGLVYTFGVGGAQGGLCIQLFYLYIQYVEDIIVVYIMHISPSLFPSLLLSFIQSSLPSSLSSSLVTQTHSFNEQRLEPGTSRMGIAYHVYSCCLYSIVQYMKSPGLWCLRLFIVARMHRVTCRRDVRLEHIPVSISCR